MPCEHEKRRSNCSAEADAQKKRKYLDERDCVAGWGDDGFQQRQLLADELMRRNDDQNSGAWAKHWDSDAEKADAGEGTTSGIAYVRDCNNVFGEKAARQVPAWCHMSQDKSSGNWH